MNDWHLIRGVCLYRPASNALLESVLLSAKQSLRDLDRSWQAPRTLFTTKANLQKQVDELEREQGSLARQVKERGRTAEALIWEQLWTDCNRLYEERRTEVTEIEGELETWIAPLREARKCDERHWVRRLMLASGDDREACLGHLERLRFEMLEEKVRKMQASADVRIERAANEALEAMRKGMGLKERAPEPDDPWDWNRHRRRGGGGWNCA